MFWQKNTPVGILTNKTKSYVSEIGLLCRGNSKITSRIKGRRSFQNVIKGGGVVIKLCHTKIGQSYFIKFNIFHDNAPITFHYFKFCQFLFLTTAKRFFLSFFLRIRQWTKIGILMTSTYPHQYKRPKKFHLILQ